MPMRISKYIAAIIMTTIFALLLILCGSIGNGRSDYQVYTINPDETVLPEDMLHAARSHNVILYSWFETQTGTMDPVCCYYTDPDQISALQKHFGVRNGKARRLGYEQDIRFLSYAELDQDTLEQLNNWYLIGPEDNCKACIRDMRGLYTIESYDSSHDGSFSFLTVIWIVMLIVLLCFCYIDAAFQKKEIAVRVIHGDSAVRHYLKLTITDVIIFSSVFFSVYLIQTCYTQIYKPYQYLYLLIIPFLLGLCIVNLHLLRIRPKEIVYGRQHGAVLLHLLSAIGKGAAVLSCLVIITTVPLISSLKNYQSTVPFFEQHKDLFFINYRSKAGNAGIREFEDPEHSPREEARDFSDYGQSELNSVTMEHAVSTDRVSHLWNMVYCNERALQYLQTVIPEAAQADFGQYDAVFMFPDILPPTEKQKAVSKLMQEFRTLENYVPEHDRIQYLQYSCQSDLLCFSDDVYRSPFEFVKLPVICIATDSNADKYTDGLVSNRYFALSGTIFQTNDLQAVEQHFAQYSGHPVIRNVYETFLYFCNLQYAVVFGALITILLALTFYITVHYIILKLDYQVNATELAIRKTLGESMLQKNRRHFVGAAAVGIVNLLLAVCLSLFAHLLPMAAAVAVPVVLFVLNILLICFMIRRVEKQKLTKILKGGAL